MKNTAVVALLMLGLSIPAFGQDKTSCKAFFQVVRVGTQTPENLRTGMNEAQKRWWENEGQKEYPGLCLDGSVSTGDKPRYLVILSKSGSIDKAAVAPGEVYGQTASVIQSTAPKEWIYQPRWNMAPISILYVSYDGNLDQPPVHIAAGDRTGWFWPSSTKVLKVAVKYLSQEPTFLNGSGPSVSGQ
ncbi:MAG: hypothetical protein ABSG27_15055 [Candidatus Acidiferrales bacterium]|jgi:hypothetical protein